MRVTHSAVRLGVPIVVAMTFAMFPPSASSSTRAAMAASCQSYVSQGPNGPGRACWLSVRVGALSESKITPASGPARAAASPRWRCSAFVSNIFRTGRDVNVWSFQGCTPKPAYTRVRVCIQMKQGFIFHWWKNLRCEERRASRAATGFVELEFATRCRGGKHKYRGQVDGYSYPPAGGGIAHSVREFQTSC
jgi:hypothetical protein